MEKVIVILGQTATGKSSLAVKIAKKIDGEIISADSRQVYKNLDIGTGKISAEEMLGIPHFLLDVANPKNKFTVVEFQRRAISAMADIARRDKTPIICGGTGLYIDAVTKGVVFPEVPPNIKLRKMLSLLSGRTLLLRLEKLDPERAKNITEKNEQNNKVRLIRAIEIAKALGKVPKITEATPPYKFIKIGLTLPIPELAKKIEKRVKKMFSKKNHGGLLNEIKKLQKTGISKKRLAELGFEYNEPTYEKVVSGSIKYAKRQMTWFKRDKEIKWFSPLEYKKIKKYLESKI